MTVEGQSLRFDLAFITRDGETKAVKMDEINQHVKDVDTELEALESIWDLLIEKYEPQEADK